MPDTADYDFTDPSDVHWYEHDMQQWAMMLRVYGSDEPIVTPMQSVSGRIREYLRLQEQLWTEVREQTIA